MEQKEDKEIRKTDENQLAKLIEIYSDAHLKKYINWENKNNFCWLNASMALIAHNKVIKRSAPFSSDSRINKIITEYEEAISMLNNPDKPAEHRKKKAAEMLNCIQQCTLYHLQPKLKYKTGDPESAFCSLYNLLLNDSVVKGIFDATWISAKRCTNCGKISTSSKRKPIITLSKIDTFDPKNPAVIYNCTCNKSEQNIMLAYACLPPCLIFHFESGAGSKKPPLSFIIQKREYHLTGLMTLEKSQGSKMNHFITWIRDPSVDKWLDCNDLNPDETTFTPDFPEIELEDIYIYMYESFDDLGTIQDHTVVNTKNLEENIPCIDILEESDTEDSNSVSNASRYNLDTKQLEVGQTLLISKLENVKITDKQNKKNMKDEKNFSSSTTNLEKCTQNNALLLAHNPENSNLGEDKSTELKDLDPAKFEHLISNDSVEHGYPKKQNKSEQYPLNSDAEQNNNDKILTPNSYCQQQGKNGAFLSDIATIKKQNETEIEDENQNVSSNITNREKNIQKKALLPGKNLKYSDIGDGKCTELTNLGCSKSGDLVSNDKIVEENLKKQNKSEFPFNSNAEQNDDKLTSNSTSQQWEKSEAFLSDVACNNSGTSYVKLSLRRKKHPNQTLRKSYCLKKFNKRHSEETEATEERITKKTVKGRRALQQKMDEVSDTVQNTGPKKKQKIRHLLDEQKHAVNEKEMDYSKPEVIKKQPKKSSQDHLKVRNPKSKKETPDKNKTPHFSRYEEECNEEHQQCSDQSPSCSSAVSEAGNSSVNQREDKILNEFEDVWCSHAPGCKCKKASIEERIDIVVDYAFAYFCKLGKGLKSRAEAASLK